jgi:hypothetical protein
VVKEPSDSAVGFKSSPTLDMDLSLIGSQVLDSFIHSFMEARKKTARLTSMISSISRISQVETRIAPNKADGCFLYGRE